MIQFLCVAKINVMKEAINQKCSSCFQNAHISRVTNDGLLCNLNISLSAMPLPANVKFSGDTKRVECHNGRSKLQECLLRLLSELTKEELCNYLVQLLSPVDENELRNEQNDDICQPKIASPEKTRDSAGVKNRGFLNMPQCSTNVSAHKELGSQTSPQVLSKRKRNIYNHEYDSATKQMDSVLQNVKVDHKQPSCPTQCTYEDDCNKSRKDPGGLPSVDNEEIYYNHIMRMIDTICHLRSDLCHSDNSNSIPEMPRAFETSLQTPLDPDPCFQQRSNRTDQTDAFGFGLTDNYGATGYSQEHVGNLRQESPLQSPKRPNYSTPASINPYCLETPSINLYSNIGERRRLNCYQNDA